MRNPTSKLLKHWNQNLDASRFRNMFDSIRPQQSGHLPRFEIY